MKKFHVVEKLEFKDNDMYLKVDGREFTFKLEKISKRLANASNVEREKYEISPSGYGIHWPLIDEDLSIDGLIGVEHKPAKNKKIVAV